MLLDQKWEACAGKGVEDAVFFVLDRQSELSQAILAGLRGELRLSRDSDASLYCWCNRPTAERVLRRLLPNADIELPRLQGHHRFYHCRVVPGCIQLSIVRARESDDNAEGFEAETLPATFRFHERG